MTIIDALFETASEDTKLLTKNDGYGDDFSKTRVVDFLLVASDEQKAHTVRDFIDDNRYGDCTVEQVGEQFRVLVRIEMPTTQNVLCSVSGLMACLGSLFEVKYDGWGCEIQSGPQEGASGRP